MDRGQTRPLRPFVDVLPVPPRRVINEPTRLTVRLETAMHRFRRDLSPSRVWAYDGLLAEPTIEVRRAFRSKWSGRTTCRARYR
jgi:hypothetical protein